MWISEQTAIISLYNINWLVFITETESVYCAVRTGYLTAIQVDFRFQRDTKQPVSDGTARQMTALSELAVVGWGVVGEATDEQ